MRIGYPCINRSIGCQSDATFRLASYSNSMMEAKVSGNLACLQRILEYNLAKGILFFRISSQLVPFASHPICDFPWRRRFLGELKSVGEYVRKKGIRISMHPDQFVLLNSPDLGVHERSVAELAYHCEALDAMGLAPDAKVQIHVGGVYGDRAAAIARFEERYRRLPSAIRKRLVIENDDRLYAVSDCIRIHETCGVPVLFDSFHHECLNAGESVREALKAAMGTWGNADGVPMTDYSSQAPGGRSGKHAETIDLAHFEKYLHSAKKLDFDVMLEIKDKEKSAIKALSILRKMNKG
ncbi:UV DNA damage repair endonuclease UvsE [Candidatus Micrarchaeota archaeon]|nr:UV DNA damage repair endonuclease UvsE [Candidatus Micrarchaeota archaeon]